MQSPVNKVGRCGDGHMNRIRVTLLGVCCKGIPCTVVLDEAWVGEIMDRPNGSVFLDKITSIIMV